MLLRFFAEKVHPYCQMGLSCVLSMLDPILVSRAHRVLHCVETPLGWRLKENAAMECYKGEHQKAVNIANVAVVIGGAAFLWSMFLPWWLFFRRAPSVQVLVDGEEQRIPVDDDARIAAADDEEEPAVGKVSSFWIKVRDGAVDFLYQLNLNPCTQPICARCKCKKSARHAQTRNVELNLARMDSIDGGLIAFGAAFDADVKPETFWFNPLTTLVSTSLGLITGLFGGTTKATDNLAVAVLSVIILAAFAATAISTWPFRNRPRDSFKGPALIGSCCVASLAKVLEFMLSLRTGNDSDAFDALWSSRLGQ